METSVALVTVIVVEPVTPEWVAEMVALPTPTPLTRESPTAPGSVAIASSEDPQVASPVRSCVVESEKVPVAVNGCDVPRAIEGAAGVTAIETSLTE
jgi:hypothetical protein